MCIALVSCKDSKVSEMPPTLVHGDLKINFNDKQLDSVITAYIKKYEVDPKQRVLSFSIYRDPMRYFYFLTQVRGQKIIESDTPDYFFVHDDRFLVLLYFGVSNFHTAKDVNIKLDSTMQKLGISLSNDSLDYNPPLWELMKDCDGRLQKRDSDFVLNYLPCGYKMKQDSLHLNNFLLMKE